MATEEKIIRLSPYFNNNIYLVAGVCWKCYAEQEDVRIVSINKQFLQNVAKQTDARSDIDLNLKYFCNNNNIELEYKQEVKLGKTTFTSVNECASQEKNVENEAQIKLDSSCAIGAEPKIVEKLPLPSEDEDEVEIKINLKLSQHSKDENGIHAVIYPESKMKEKLSSLGSPQENDYLQSETESKTNTDEKVNDSLAKRHTFLNFQYEVHSPVETIPMSVKTENEVKTQSDSITKYVRVKLENLVKHENALSAQLKNKSDSQNGLKKEFKKPTTRLKLERLKRRDSFSSLFPMPKTEDKFVWFPPVSPHNLIEESLFHSPWHLLVATIFLNKTTCALARPCLMRFFRELSKPEEVKTLYISTRCM